MSDIKPGIPKGIENGIRNLPDVLSRRRPVENHQVDIGKGEKLLPPIAAQGHQRHRFSGSGQLRGLETLKNELIDKPTVTAKQGMTAQPLLPQLLQRFTLRM